jgi:hypothetical protein
MITREDLVVQSVTDYAKAQVRAWGYDEDVWTWEERFDAAKMAKFDKTIIAAGFDFTDGGRQAECGSDLKERVYHIEFAVFGKTLTLGRNISSALRDAVEQDAVIPLLDYQDPAKPQIDALELLAVSSNRATPPDPEPWEEFLWLVAAQVQDVYHARLS